MQKFFRSLLLAAFSAGLLVGLGQRSRTALGIIGLFVSFFGFLYGLCAAPGIRDHAPVDVHETVVAETFENLTPLEAAALVGVLHEYRIASTAGERSRAESLELHSAVDLASRASGFRREYLSRLYRDHWHELRRTTAPRLVELLERHQLVGRVFPYSEGV